MSRYMHQSACMTCFTKIKLMWILWILYFGCGCLTSIMSTQLAAITGCLIYCKVFDQKKSADDLILKLTFQTLI